MLIPRSLTTGGDSYQNEHEHAPMMGLEFSYKINDKFDFTTNYYHIFADDNEAAKTDSVFLGAAYHPKKHPPSKKRGLTLPPLLLLK